MSLFDKAAPGVTATLCIAALIAMSDAAVAQAPATQAPATQKAAKAPSKAKAAADAGETAATPKKRDPAEAQRLVDAGIKHLQSNKAEPAIQTFTAAIAGGLPPPLMAKALHGRGSAYRIAGKPAQAISDLTSALWLKNGLADADRQDAIKQRTDAYREAGLPDQTGEDGKPAGTSTATRTARATAATATAPAPAVATASLAPTAPAQPTQTGGLFASLFGGGSRAAAAPAPAQVRAPAPAPAATSAWSSATEVKSAPGTPPAPRARPAATAAPAAPVKTAALAPTQATATAAAAAPAPGIHARIALVRNDQEAQAVIQKLKANHAAAIGNKTTATSQTAFGGMGTFVQVRVGPYATIAEADAFCKKLKGGGLDCVPVDR